MARQIKHQRMSARGKVFSAGGKVDVTKNFRRFRQRYPKDFEEDSFRTIDPGRPGHTKLVIGRLKGEKTTTVQSVLEERW